MKDWPCSTHSERYIQNLYFFKKNGSDIKGSIVSRDKIGSQIPKSNKHVSKLTDLRKSLLEIVI